MKTRSTVALAFVSGSAWLAFSLAVGCGGSQDSGAAGGSDNALSTPDSATSYSALAGTWTALDPVPAAADDGTPSFTSYTFAKGGTFAASRACASTAAAACTSGTTTETGSWKVFTSVPNLPSVELTWSSGSENYTFSMQNDLLVLDGIDALFQHDVSVLPTVADGSTCEDTRRNSLAQCADPTLACDHETHRCDHAS
jgi:hypothetical protein